MTLYHDVLANLYGEDRQDAVKAMENDAAFDRWLITFESKRAQMDQQASGKRTASSGSKAMSKDDYIKRFKAEV